MKLTPLKKSGSFMAHGFYGSYTDHVRIKNLLWTFDFNL